MTGSSISVICFYSKCFAKLNKSGLFLLFNCLLFLVCSTGLVDAAPHKSKNKGRDGPQMVYDQKQTGDYNIQLHLKDFQIIALLGDEALGDYDYNYDYADFTVKPSGPASTSTTPKPTSTARPTSTTAKLPTSTSQLLPIVPISSSESTDIKPIEIALPETSNSHAKPSSAIISNIHPYPIEVVVLEPTTKQPAEKSKGKPSEKPTEELEASTSENSLNEILGSSSSSPQSFEDFNISSSTTSLSTKFSSTTEPITPGKIKVQILEAPEPTVGAVIPVGIVPGEDVQSDVSGGLLQGEFASYRRCASGFSRDKKGRCRRVRKPGVSPQLPYGFSRLASNLATRLKLPTQEIPLDAPSSKGN